MASRKKETAAREHEQIPAIKRLVPTQQRSRERYERILASAVKLMVERGSDSLRMSDIVEQTGIAFGSLYQYFPDKTAIIATLAERYNQLGHACVRKELSNLTSLEELHMTLERITDSYYQFFLDEPGVLQVWEATQADRSLQVLDRDDGIYLTGLLIDALRPHAGNSSDETLANFCEVCMVMIAAAVRHAITLPANHASKTLGLFKKLLPADLTSVSVPPGPAIRKGPGAPRRRRA